MMDGGMGWMDGWMHRRPGQSSCAEAALDTFTSVRLFQIESKKKRKKSTYVHTHAHIQILTSHTHAYNTLV